MDLYILVCTSYTPSRLICTAIQKTIRGTLNHHDTGNPDATSMIDDAIGLAAINNLVIVFAASEIRHVYLNDSIWSELHGLITDTGAVTLLSDSGTLLRNMFQRSEQMVLRRHFTVSNDLPQSLNDDKIRIISSLIIMLYG